MALYHSGKDLSMDFLKRRLIAERSEQLNLVPRSQHLLGHHMGKQPRAALLLQRLVTCYGKPGELPPEMNAYGWVTRDRTAFAMLRRMTDRMHNP